MRSLLALASGSPWTFAGWLATAGYFVVAGYDGWRAASAYAHLDYVFVAALTIAFIVAGVRREPQAEPWWWPRRDAA